jgi:hypothetical protein
MKSASTMNGGRHRPRALPALRFAPHDIFDYGFEDELERAAVGALISHHCPERQLGEVLPALAASSRSRKNEDQ